jgi:Omp85 superfamily domain
MIRVVAAALAALAVAGRARASDGVYVDRTDIWKAVGIGGEEQSAIPEPFEPVFSVLPAVGFNPAAGLLLGAYASVGIYLGDRDTTTISSGSAQALVSTNRQLILQLNGVAMTARNEWELQSDWRLLLFNQDTFGLGTGTAPISTGISIGGWGDTSAVGGGQPIDFNLVRIHQIALRRVVGALYAGGGIRFDRYFEIVDRRLDLEASPPVITSHYAYSKYFGFKPGSYTVSSASVSLLYDSRDSTVNPYRGVYATLDYRISPTFLGSSKASSLLYSEVRHYVGLSRSVPRNVLAIWVLAQGVLTGDVPYLALPSEAWDAKNATGRGYPQGRFRGPSEIYGEVELRFRITDNGLVGGTVFANARTFSRPSVSIPGYENQGEGLFHTVVPAGGFGLRFMLSRGTRNNVRLDFGFGENSAAFYLGLGEVF